VIAVYEVWSSGMQGRNPLAALGALITGILIFVALFLSIEIAGGLTSHYGLCRRCPYEFEIWMFLSIIAILGTIVALSSGRRVDPNAALRRRRSPPIRAVWRTTQTVWAVIMLALAATSISHAWGFAWFWSVRVEVSAAATFVPAFIVLSLVWTMRVAAHHGARILQGTTLGGAGIDLLKGTLGAGIGSVAAGLVMVWRGADLWALAAPQIFYGLLIPAIAGFGWTAAWPKTGSGWFSAMLVFMAFGMALFSMKYSYSATTKPRCEPVHQAGTHCVSGYYTQFCREPWTWEVVPVDILFVPTALGQLTVNHLWHPLDSMRC
jgi:hypothetical protein